jgi:hypothetical protein
VYGLTRSQFNAMKARQDGKCAICEQVPVSWQIDHCHDTGAIRGLLCNLCNMALGSFKDDPVRVLRALHYLRKPPNPANQPGTYDSR